MLTMLTAITHEIDDAETAVSEVLAQLDLANRQRNHSVGILTCYPEFLDTGVAKAICDSLPFDVVGCSSYGSGTADDAGLMALTISVLTSDKVAFSVALSDAMSDDNLEPLAHAYAQALDALPDAPSMILPFVPVADYMSGNVFIDYLNKVSGGLPIFGTLPSDHTTDYSQSFVLFNGEPQHDRVVLVLLSGPVVPRFYIVSIREGSCQKQNAIVTAAEGNVLHKVNDIPAIDYLATIGLVNKSDIDTIKIVPFQVDYNDGTTPVVCGIYKVLENGSAICGARIPCNSTLSIGSLDRDDIVATSGNIIREALASGKTRAILCFSCICRGWALGMDTMAEFESVRDACGTVPYHISYSGGEICPVHNEKGEIFNRFHNFTFTLCAFESV